MIKNVWIETTRNDGPKRSHRKEGELAIGKAIWAPLVDKGGQDAYRSMKMVGVGDVIIHAAINEKRIVGTSLVISKKIQNIKGPEGDYEDVDCMLWKLGHFKDFREMQTTIPVMDHLNEDKHLLLLEEIKDTHTSFYATGRKNASNNFEFKGKGYLFPVSKELLTFLNRIYKQKHFNNIPHIKSNLIYPSAIDLGDLFYDNLEKIKEDNKDIGGFSEYQINHNNAVLEFEKQFKKMDWKEIGSLVKIKKYRGDIDLFLLHEKTVIILEYKTTGKKNIRDEYNKWNGKKTRYLEYLYNEHEETKGKFNKVVYLFVVKNTTPPDVTDEESYHRGRSTIEYDGGIVKINDKENNKRLKIEILTHRILHNEQLKYYFERARTIDPLYAKRLMFTDFGINPEDNNYMVVPAIELIISHKGIEPYKVYNFSCSPKKLLKFASVSVRAPVKEDLTYYQRILSGKRIKDIGEDFIDKNAGYFPNNIILKLNPGKQTFISFKDKAYEGIEDKELEKIDNSTSETNDIGILTIKENYNSAWVIDGQHRLFSYMKSKKNKDINNTINVAAFVGVDQDKEAQYFLDINDNQTGVDSDLIWDLNGIVRPQSDQGIISNACKKIYENDGEFNIFYNNLSIPSRQNKSKSFKYSAFCTNLYTWCSILGKKYDRYNPNKPNQIEKGIKNPFYDKNAKKMSLKIGNGFANFFITLHERIGEKRFHEVFLPVVKNKPTQAENFVYIFTRIAENYFKHYRTSIISKNNNFFDVLSDIINRIDDDRLKAYRQGTNNELRLDTLADLNNEINREISGFARVPESKLKKNIKEFMEKTFPEYIYKKTHKELGLNFAMHCDAFKNQRRGWMRKLNFDTTLSKKTKEEKQEMLWKKADFQKDIFKGFIFNRNSIKIPKNHDLEPKYQKHIKQNQTFNVWDNIFKEIFTYEEGNVSSAKFINRSQVENLVLTMAYYRATSFAHEATSEEEKRDTWDPQLRKKLETDFGILKDIIKKDKSIHNI